MTHRRYPARRGAGVRPQQRRSPPVPSRTTPPMASSNYTGQYQPAPSHNTPPSYQQPPPSYTRPPVRPNPGYSAPRPQPLHNSQPYTSQPSYPSPQPQPVYPNNASSQPYAQTNRRRAASHSTDGLGSQIPQTPSPTNFLAQAKPLAPLKVMNSHPKTLAWCPEETGRNLFAIGSNQKHLTANFQSTISLEIVDANLSGAGKEMNIKGSLQYDTCFSKLAWGAHPNLEMGLLAGGMESGALTFWDPAKVSKSDCNSLFCVADNGHTEAITDVHFNPGKPNYLASASLDGKVLVWDVSDLANITHTPAKIEDSSRPIWAVRWNTQVPYIIAAGNDHGQIFILDLKTERLVMTIRSSTSAIPNTIAWNPANAMEFAVAWKSGNPEIWDLRVAMKPTVTLPTSPQQEVRYLAWCPHDTALIATASDDRICRIYSPQPKDKDQQRLIHHFIFEDVNFICEWNPQHPGMLATSSVNGKVSLRSVNYTGPRHVPSWLNIKAGSQLGFGGKYIHFKQVNEEQSPRSSMAMNHVPADALIMQLAQELQRDLVQMQQNEVPLPDLIKSKADRAETPEERTIWEMMMLGFNQESQKAMVQYLGFISETVADTPVVVTATASPAPAAVMEPPKETEVESFFANLSSTNNLLELESKEEQSSESKDTKISDKPTEQQKLSALSAKVDGKGLSEEEIKIQKSLVVGDYQTAVDRSLKLGLFADALIFARYGGENLWKQAQTAYFNSHKNTFVSQTMKRVMHGDLQSLVVQSDLAHWKETAAIILSYGSNRVPVLIRALCDRLVNERHDYFAAVQACLCSGDVDRMAGLLTKERQSRSNVKSAPETLHKSIEKILFFSSLPKMCDLGGNEEVLKDTFAAYVDMLTSNGAVYEAYFILQSNIQILNNRRQKISKDYEMMSNMLREALGLNQQQVPNQQVGQGYQKVDQVARANPPGVDRGAGIRPAVGAQRVTQNGRLPVNTRPATRPGHHKVSRHVRHTRKAPLRPVSKPQPVMGRGQPPADLPQGPATHSSPAFRSGVVGQVNSPTVPPRNIPPVRHGTRPPAGGNDAPGGITRRPPRSNSGFFGQHPAKQVSSVPPPVQQPMQPMPHAPNMYAPQQQPVDPNSRGVAPRPISSTQHQAPPRRTMRANQTRPRGY